MGQIMNKMKNHKKQKMKFSIIRSQIENETTPSLFLFQSTLKPKRMKEFLDTQGVFGNNDDGNYFLDKLYSRNNKPILLHISFTNQNESIIGDKKDQQEIPSSKINDDNNYGQNINEKVYSIKNNQKVEGMKNYHQKAFSNSPNKYNLNPKTCLLNEKKCLEQQRYKRQLNLNLDKDIDEIRNCQKFAIKQIPTRNNSQQNLPYINVNQKKVQKMANFNKLHMISKNIKDFAPTMPMKVNNYKQRLLKYKGKKDCLQLKYTMHRSYDFESETNYEQY